MIIRTDGFAKASAGAPQRTPATEQVGEHEIHIWYVHVDGLPDGDAVLSADEIARAVRFVREADRKRFAMHRVALRRVLAAYTGTPAEKLQFQYAEHGKPSLGGPNGGSPIRFNMSHSQGIGAIAVAKRREVGVDVECPDRRPDYLEIARRFFAAEEVDALMAVHADERHIAFLNAWTRKEAYLKAAGTGLSLGLDQIVVTLAPNAPAKIVSAPDSERWTLYALNPPSGCAGALVAEGPPCSVQAFSYSYP